MSNSNPPLAYQEGTVEFYDCTITVNPSVLIPRQETEILIDKALSRLKGQPPLKVLDLCCGSGCMGLAIKQARPQDDVHLSDISPQALAVAQHNSTTNALSVTLHQGDLYIPPNIEALFCNPPYVTTEEWKHLEPSVKDFEPRLALDGGPSGLDFYERLAQQLHAQTIAPKFCFFEIGATQGNVLCQLFTLPSYHLDLLKDWAGHDRFLFLQKSP